MKKRLTVNTRKCIGCGACLSIASKSFSLDEKDINAVSVPFNPYSDSDEDVKLAIDACPTRAISLK